MPEPTNRCGNILLFAVPASAAVSVFVADQVTALHQIWLLFFAATFALVCIGLFLILQVIFRLKRTTLTFVVLMTVTTIGIVSKGSDLFQPPSAVDLQFSDGTHSDNVTPTEGRHWGSPHAIWFLHPAYDNVRVPDRLTASFRKPADTVEILVTKPPEAVYLPGQKPAPSDGVSLEISGTDGTGALLPPFVLVIPESRFLNEHWISRTISDRHGIATVSVRVTAGPPGSTTFFDSTLVSLRVRGVHGVFHAVGRLLISGMAALVLSLILVAPITRRANSTQTSRPVASLLVDLAPVAAVYATVLVLVYWLAARTLLIFFWDSRNYWEKTEQLYSLMHAHMWHQAVSLVSTSLPTDYTYLPAVLPALFSLPLAFPGRIQFIIVITCVYAIPAYLMVAFLGRQLLERDGSLGTTCRWALAAIVPALAFPVFLKVVLDLMPDIGGVVPCVAATLLATTLTQLIASPTRPEHPWSEAKNLVMPGLALGVLLALLFLFRRWYVFFAVGLVLASVLCVTHSLLLAQGNRRAVLVRTISTVSLIFVATLPIMGPIVFDWLGAPAAHNYADLYASYAKPAAQSLLGFVGEFGILYPVLAVGAILSLRNIFRNRRLVFILVATSVIASSLFFSVQSPGPQHYYLLMPLFGASVCGFCIDLARRKGTNGASLFVVVILGGGLVGTFVPSQSIWVKWTFPSYQPWTPPAQTGLAGLIQIGDWLISPDIRDKRFCLVSSSQQLNQSVLLNVWQVNKSVRRGTLKSRIEQLGEIDSRDGAPWESLKKCEVMLVAVPFQSHIRPSEQYTMKIIQNDMLSHTGIGAAYERMPQQFHVGDKITVLTFGRSRPLSESEYRDIVDRFHRQKQAEHK